MTGDFFDIHHHHKIQRLRDEATVVITFCRVTVVRELELLELVPYSSSLYLSR